MHLQDLMVQSPHVFEFLLLLLSIAAGIFGALLGLGGGIVIVPALTLLFGIHIRYAIGASIVAVIATSSGAAAAYVRDRMTNIRVAMFLEVATTLGALIGAALSTRLASRYLFLAFATIMILSAYMMFRRRATEERPRSVLGSRLAHRLRLNSSYPDRQQNREVAYGVQRVGLGFLLMLGAGVLSGLLGVGSGVLKVPAMDAAMNLPIKVSTATSNFMIGVTAAASAGFYFSRGDIVPFLVAPVALGVFIGAWIGTKLMARLKSSRLRVMFIAVLVFVALQMALRFVKGGG